MSNNNLSQSNSHSENPTKKIGAVLLGNWVEERSVETLLLSEQDFKILSRQGHKELLNHNSGGDKDKFLSTNRYDYKSVQEDITKKKGPRELKEERALLEQAKKECEKAPEVLTTKDWESVTRKDFYESKTIKSFLHDPEFAKRIANEAGDKGPAITFWNNHTGESSSGFYASNYDSSNSFKRKAAFSCPISEYSRSLVKDL